MRDFFVVCWEEISSLLMEEAVRRFIGELTAKPEVLGVAVFGSYARGEARPDSAVDVFVLVPEGVRRDVERRGERTFEMV